jgi:hypothetical protein
VLALANDPRSRPKQLASGTLANVAGTTGAPA